MIGSLTGVSALVTGAGSGIGRATALLFAESGARVLCADIDAGAAQDIAGEIVKKGGAGVAAECDIVDPASVSDAVGTGVAVHGPITVAAHFAGIAGNGKAADVDGDTWHRVILTDLTGTWHVVRAVLPGMTAAGKGSIVLTASTSAMRGAPGAAAYAAAKGGVLALTQQLAVDYAADGIRVNCLSPGTVVTPLLRRSFAEKGILDSEGADRALDAIAAGFPLGRLGQPADIASAALFLASDASSWITGTNMAVDGGLTMSAWPVAPAAQQS